jgi:hypothetical protein
METFIIIAGLAVALAVSVALLLRLQAAHPAARQQRYAVAHERRLAELRLQQLTFAALLRLLDEARRSR